MGSGGCEVAGLDGVGEGIVVGNLVGHGVASGEGSGGNCCYFWHRCNCSYFVREGGRLESGLGVGGRGCSGRRLDVLGSCAMGLLEYATRRSRTWQACEHSGTCSCWLCLTSLPCFAWIRCARLLAVCCYPWFSHFVRAAHWLRLSRARGCSNISPRGEGSVILVALGGPAHGSRSDRTGR